jgi:hypothetical protein
VIRSLLIGTNVFFGVLCLITGSAPWLVAASFATAALLWSSKAGGAA